MRSIVLGLGASLGAAMMAVPAGAATYTVYDCTFVFRGMGGEQTDLAILLDEAGRAFTIDTREGSEEPYLRPVTARKTQSGDVIYALTLEQRAPDYNLMKLDFRLRIPEAGGRSRGTLTARGYYGQMTGAGNCKRLERQNVSF